MIEPRPRHPAFPLALLFAAPTLACSSHPAASAPEPAAIGAPCDPSLAYPCAPALEVCTEVACDPQTRVCESEPYDTSACAPDDAGFDGATPIHDGGVGDPCTTGADCQYPLSCVASTCLG